MDFTVVHHVTGGLIPGCIGTDQRRRYRIRGDTRSVSDAEPWGGRTFIRVRR